MAIVRNKTEPKMTINNDKMEKKLIHNNLLMSLSLKKTHQASRKCNDLPRNFSASYEFLVELLNSCWIPFTTFFLSCHFLLRCTNVFYVFCVWAAPAGLTCHPNWRCLNQPQNPQLHVNFHSEL